MAESIQDYYTWSGDIPIEAWVDYGGVKIEGYAKTNKQPNCTSQLGKYDPTPRLIYKGAHSNDLYYLSGSDDGYTQTELGVQSNEAPSVCETPNAVIAAMKDANSDEILIGTTYDIVTGQTWTSAAISSMPGGINPKCQSGPAIAFFQNKIYIAYLGHSENSIWLCWYDGKEWAGNVKVADMPGGNIQQSSKSPALCATEDNLILAYKGQTNGDLYLSWFDGTQWYGDQAIKAQNGGVDSQPQTTDTPAIANIGGNLMLAYKGDSNNYIYNSFQHGLSLSTDTVWIGDIRISDFNDIDPQTQGSGPCLGSVLSTVGMQGIMFYRGTTFDRMHSASVSPKS